jgi:integrase
MAPVERSGGPAPAASSRGGLCGRSSKGELLKLEWPDVDMKRREFTLRDTKNGESRVVPMTEEVYEVF